MERTELTDKVAALMTEARQNVTLLPVEQITEKVKLARSWLLNASGFVKMGEDYQRARESYVKEFDENRTFQGAVVP